MQTQTVEADVERAGHVLGDVLVLKEDRTIACGDCGHDFGPATRDPKLGAVVRERSMVDLSAHNHHGLVDEVVAREFYCPDCAALLAVNVQRVGDPILIEMSLDPVR